MREPDHINEAAVFHKLAEPPGVVLPGIVEVDDDLDVGEYCLGGCITGIAEGGEILPSVLDVTAFVPKLSGWPEHSVSCLIAYLHPFRSDSFGLQSIEHIGGMV